MATHGTTLRRGLPRRPGGDAWPAAREVEIGVAGAPTSSEPAATRAVTASSAATGTEPMREASPSVAASTGEPPLGSAPIAPGIAVRDVRRGLPRTSGGEPWPPARDVAVAAEPTPVSEHRAAAPVSPAPSTIRLRRGLPRTPDGERWPEAGFAPDRTVQVQTAIATVAKPQPKIAPLSPTTHAQMAAPAATLAQASPEVDRAPGAPTSVPTAPETAPSRLDAEPAPSTAFGVAEKRDPLALPRTVFPGEAARVFEEQRRSGRRVISPQPQRIGPFTRSQWVGAAIVGGAGMLVALGMLVAFTRWFLSLGFMQDFLVAFPGEYHLPETAPVGLPMWIGWQHFFNVFLMVLIIRSGLQVRHEKKPPAYWSPRWNRSRKISLNLWFHQSLDILWLVNGTVFVVLLFVTGQWMRLVPTSWEVFPNALSAGLQYVSLDWPTENGWVNYNSLQQLAYFTTVFLAAPLAVITGVRMSGLWPADAKVLNRVYPVELARAVHFPVMIYFVLFIIVHVSLVFATGALRNLNHMYASQGSVDGMQYAENWAGFWIFFTSILVIAGAWTAARPLVLAPIARLFGTVSAR